MAKKIDIEDFQAFFIKYKNFVYKTVYFIVEDPNRGDEWSHAWLSSNAGNSNWCVGASPSGGLSSGALIEIYSLLPSMLRYFYHQ